MIDLIDQVRRVQMRTGNNPVVVHCRLVVVIVDVVVCGGFVVVVVTVGSLQKIWC